MLSPLLSCQEVLAQRTARGRNPQREEESCVCVRSTYSWWCMGGTWREREREVNGQISSAFLPSLPTNSFFPALVIVFPLVQEEYKNVAWFGACLWWLPTPTPNIASRPSGCLVDRRRWLVQIGSFHPGNSIGLQFPEKMNRLNSLPPSSKQTTRWEEGSPVQPEGPLMFPSRQRKRKKEEKGKANTDWPIVEREWKEMGEGGEEGGSLLGEFLSKKKLTFRGNHFLERGKKKAS